MKIMLGHIINKYHALPKEEKEEEKDGNHFATSLVKCGAHTAPTCAECSHEFHNPYLVNFLWFAWCNEDCKWDIKTKTCNEKNAWWLYW